MDGGLKPANVGRNFRFERLVDGLAEIMAKQDIFGRNGDIGLKLEAPVPVVGLRVRKHGIGPGDGCA